MARTSLQNIMALPDAASTWNFALFFPTIPGSNMTDLTFRVMSTSIPASKVEPMEIQLAGVKKVEAGRAMYDGTFQVTFLETVDYADYLALRKWRDYTRSWKRNSGTSFNQYAINLELDVFDNAGAVSQTFILVGAWLNDIADISLNGGESAAVNLQATFSFQYVDDGATW